MYPVGKGYTGIILKNMLNLAYLTRSLISEPEA